MSKRIKHLPLCPHCDNEILKVIVHVLPLEESIPFSGSHFGTRDRCIVASCPTCKRAIGTYDYYEE